MATQTDDGSGVQGGAALPVYLKNLAALVAAITAAANGQVEGVLAQNAAWPANGRPVVVGFIDVNGNVVPLGLSPSLEIPVMARLSTPSGVSLLTSSSGGSADALVGTGTLLVAAAMQRGFNGATWDRLRVATVFKPVALVSGTTETTIWTPAAAKKFRLLGFLLTCGAASTLTFKDNTGGTTIFAARGGTDVPINAPPMGNGILSAAANNVLTVTRGTACTLDGVVFGTEE